MDNWIPIRYRGFYDVPRFFLTSYRGKQILFSCPFDEQLDEYPNTYQVYLVPEFSEEELKGDWEELHLKAGQFLGEVAVTDVAFDSTRRKEIEATILDNLFQVSHPKKA